MPRLRRRPPGRRRRAEVGDHGPRRPAARAGPARPAPGPRPVREPTPGAAQLRAGRCQPATRGSDRRHRPAGGPRAHRRHLLRRQRTRRGSRPRHLRVLAGGDRADRKGRLPGGARPGGGRLEGAASDLGRQGQRARDLAPVARNGRERGRRLSRGRVGAPAGGQRSHATRLRAGPVRRHPDREPVRRHPLRRGRDAHRLARDAALGEPGRGWARPVRAGARLGARHRGQGGRQPARHLPLGGDDASSRARPGGRGDGDRGRRGSGAPARAPDPRPRGRRGCRRRRPRWGPRRSRMRSSTNCELEVGSESGILGGRP